MASEPWQHGSFDPLPHLKYLKVVLRHKWYVLRFGWGTVPLWRLIKHDWTKFTPSEWPAYVNRFASGRAGKEDKTGDDQAFRDAWKHHWRHNPHHWEYWVYLIPGWETPFEMPETYVYEMIADWKAASKAYSGKDNCWGWYERTRDRQTMHPSTRALVESVLRRDIQKVKFTRMQTTDEKVCMVLDCEGTLATHPEAYHMYVCHTCGVVQRKEMVMFGRQYDRANAHMLAMR